MSRSENQDVTLAKSHTFGLFTLFQFRGGDGVAGLQPLDAADAGDVEQNPPADDTMSVSGNVVGIRPTGRNTGGGLSVIELALVCHMAKSVNVSLAVTMNLTGKIVESKTRFVGNGAVIERLSHVVRDRVRVVWTGNVIDRNSHRNSAP